MPHPCQNGCESAVPGGHLRSERTGPDMDTRRTVQGLQRSSKQPVILAI